jgi:fatty acid desaturase
VQQHFENDEIHEILNRAILIETETESKRKALLATAAELGISEESLSLAEEQLAREREVKQFNRGRRVGFWQHLLVYATVNAFLVFVYFISGSSSFWPIWPIVAWGVAVLIHLGTVLIEGGEEYEKELAEWRTNRRQNRP